MGGARMPPGTITMLTDATMGGACKPPGPITMLTNLAELARLLCNIILHVWYLTQNVQLQVSTLCSIGTV